MGLLRMSALCAILALSFTPCCRTQGLPDLPDPDDLPLDPKCFNSPKFFKFLPQCGEKIGNTIVPLVSTIEKMIDGTCLDDMSCKVEDIPQLLSLIASIEPDIDAAASSLCEKRPSGDTCWSMLLDLVDDCLDMSKLPNIPGMVDTAQILEAAALLCDIPHDGVNCGMKILEVLLAEDALVESGSQACGGTTCTQECQNFVQTVYEKVGCCFGDFIDSVAQYKELACAAMPGNVLSAWAECAVGNDIKTCSDKTVDAVAFSCDDIITPPNHDNDDDDGSGDDPDPDSTDDPKGDVHGQHGKDGDEDDNNNNGSSGLSGTTTAVIAVAAGLVLMIILAAAVMFRRRRRHGHTYLSFQQRDNSMFDGHSDDGEFVIDEQFDDVDMLDLDEDPDMYDAPAIP